MLGGSTITPFAVTSGAGAPLLGSDGQTYRVPAGQALSCWRRAAPR